MSWLRIDDRFTRNRKIRRLSDKAFRLHVGGLCYCAANLTDGTLDSRDVRVVCAELDLAKPRNRIDELINADLWLPVGDGGFLIKDFLEYNPAAEAAKDLKNARREAGRLGGVRSGQSRRGEANEALASPFASSNGVGGLLEPRPVPSPKDQKTLGEIGMFSLDRVVGVAGRAALTGGSL